MKISVKLAEKIGRDGTLYTLSHEDFSKICRSPKLLKAWKYGIGMRELEGIKSHTNDIKQNSSLFSTVYYVFQNLVLVWLGGSLIAGYFSISYLIAYQIIFVMALMIPMTGIVFANAVRKLFDGRI